MKFFFIFSFFVLVLLLLPAGDADATHVCEWMYYEDGIGWVRECPTHCSSNVGQACTKSNACDTNYGTYDCDGVCTATEPDPVPTNYGNTCRNSNSCGTTGSWGSIQCDGTTCSGSTPSTPYTVGATCTSPANACGSTSGTISDACTGTCSPPATPYSATSCTSTANACGSTSGTTDVCTGACTPPATPYTVGASCTSTANACGSTSGSISDACTGTCSPPATPYTVGNSCTSTANNVGSTSGTISDACAGTCSPPADATISVSVSTSPTSGTAPLNNVKITGDAGGTATGDIIYKLDCTDDGTYEQEITTSTDPYTFTTKCNYSTGGSYTPKVHITRQGLTASNTATVTVWGVSLAADPSGNVANTTSVKYTATASSTVSGTPYYIRIYEGTTQRASCGSDKTCTTDPISDSNTTRSFVAKVETTNAGTVIITSSTISTTWSKITTQLPDSDFYFDPTTIVQGNSTTVRGWLKTSSGAGIGGKTIDLQCWNGTSWPQVVSSTTETASPNIGYTSFSWTPTSSWNGDISCRLDFAGDAIYASSTSGQETIAVTPACDSTSYTACSTAKDFGSGGSLGTMCGADQYYQAVVPAGNTCDVLFSLTPDSSSDYDLYVENTAAACPATYSWDCKSTSGTGINDQCTTTNLGPGTYKALVHKYSGTGSYAIASSVSNCKALQQCAAPQITEYFWNPGADSLTLKWNAVTSVKSYFMEWTKWGSGYTFCLVPGCTPDSETVTTTSHTTPRLSKNTTYKLHVRAETSSGSTCSAPGLFSQEVELYVGQCQKTSAPRTDSFTVPVQTMDGTKDCTITATHSGRDYYDSAQGKYDTNVSYQETACQANPATSSSNIQDVTCQTSSTTNSSTVAMDDDPVTGCNNNLMFTNAFGIPGTGVLNAIGEVNKKDAGHRLSFGYELTTSQCVITGVQKVATATTEMPDGSYVNPDGSGLSPVVSADKKSASYQQAIYNNTSSTSQTSNFTFALKECTQDSHCSSVTDKTYCNVSGGTRNVSAFPQNTCLDSIKPTTTIGTITRTSTDPGVPGTDSKGEQWLKQGTYSIAVSDIDNSGGAGLDISGCTFTVRDIGPDGTFGVNPSTGVDDDKKYSAIRSCDSTSSFNIYAGPPQYSYNDCVTQGGGKCLLEITTRDKAGNIQTTLKYLNIDYTPPTAQ